jgi:hypothetical protein
MRERERFVTKWGRENIGINDFHLQMYNIAYLPSALCHRDNQPTRLRRLKIRELREFLA